MSSMEECGRQSSLTRAVECLSDPRRRRLLATLRDEGASVTERELAETHAAADWTTSAGMDVSDDRREIRTRLRHVHLPQLAAADLVTWNEVADRVSLTDHPFNENERFRGLLDADEQRWEATSTVYGDERRRIAFGAVASSDGPVARTEIARVVADRVADAGASGTTEEIAVQLHHSHLPQLDQAGLIDYDAAEGTAVRTDDVQLPPIDAESFASAETGR